MTPERFAQLARLPADTRRGPERELWEALVAERDAAEMAYAIADAASIGAITSESMKGIDTQARCVTLYVHLLGGLLCISVDRECALRQKLAHEHVDQHLYELRGKHLACWCQIGKPCHADILLILANNPMDVAFEKILQQLEAWNK